MSDAPAGTAPKTTAERAEALAERVREGLGGLMARAASRAASTAGKGAGRLREAAQGLRRSAAFQHALAARDRGNLEAAFWLLHEEWAAHPDEPELAQVYWDAAVALHRVDVAAPAAVLLVQQRAGAGEVESAAQYWCELVAAAPDVLVPPPALARILPILCRRVAEASDDERHRVLALAASAVRHAVDPRNEAPTPGVALRLFEEGRDVNPEAARRAAQIALDSPDLHETKRERLRAWLAGQPIEATPPASSPKAAERTQTASPATPPKASAQQGEAERSRKDEAGAQRRKAERSRKDGAGAQRGKAQRNRKDTPGAQRAAGEPGPAGASARKAKSRSDADAERALSEDEIARAAARLPRPSPAPLIPAETLDSDDAPELEVVDDSSPELEVDPFDPEAAPARPAAAPATAEARAAEPAEGPAVEADGPDADDEAVLEAEPIVEAEPIATAESEDDAGAAPSEVPEPAGDAGITVLEAIPLELRDAALVARTSGGERRIDWADIEAVSAAAVGGVAVIDLVFNWSRRGQEPLRVVRLRSDAFDPAALVPGATDAEVALPGVLSEILDRTHAVPLPDPESALGLQLAAFDDLEAYERAVLRGD